MRAAAILFCKTARGTTRNVVMAWAAAARARARGAPERRGERVALRTSRGGEAAAMVAAEAAAMVAAEAAAETKATAESEKKAAKSKSFLSAFRGPSRKSTDKKSSRLRRMTIRAFRELPSANPPRERLLPAGALRDDAGDGVPVALAASVARIVRDVLCADWEGTLGGRS